MIVHVLEYGCTSTSMRAFCMAASCCTWRMICILLSSAIVWDMLGYGGLEMFVKVVAIGWWNWGLSKKLATSMKLLRYGGRGRERGRSLGSATAGPLSVPRGKATHHKHPELTTCLLRPLRVSPTPGSLLFASSFPLRLAPRSQLPDRIVPSLRARVEL
jgi:hypothetical protein